MRKEFKLSFLRSMRGGGATTPTVVFANLAKGLDPDGGDSGDGWCNLKSAEMSAGEGLVAVGQTAA